VFAPVADLIPQFAVVGDASRIRNQIPDFTRVLCNMVEFFSLI